MLMAGIVTPFTVTVGCVLPLVGLPVPVKREPLTVTLSAIQVPAAGKNPLIDGRSSVVKVIL